MVEGLHDLDGMLEARMNDWKTSVSSHYQVILNARVTEYQREIGELRDKLNNASFPAPYIPHNRLASGLMFSHREGTGVAVVAKKLHITIKYIQDNNRIYRILPGCRIKICCILGFYFDREGKYLQAYFTRDDGGPMNHPHSTGRETLCITPLDLPHAVSPSDIDFAEYAEATIDKLAHILRTINLDSLARDMFDEIYEELIDDYNENRYDVVEEQSVSWDEKDGWDDDYDEDEEDEDEDEE